MARTTQETSVTSTGVPNGLDLGSSDMPTTEDINALEAAMEEAGLEEVAPDAPATEEPANPEADEVVEPVDEPAAEPEKPAEEEKPEDKPAEEGTPEEQEAKRKEELETLDLDTIVPPRGTSPTNIVNFNRLRDTAKHFKEVAAQAEAKVKEVEARASGEVPKEVLSELEDLRKFRKIFDTENDPEFKKQYDEKLGAIDEDVISILKKNGLDADTEKAFRDRGLHNIPAKVWEESILPKLPSIDKRRIENRLADRADLSDKKTREVEAFSTNREKYLAEREEAEQKQFEEHNNKVTSHVREMTKGIEWANRKEIPATATAAQKKQIEEHNAEVAKVEEMFQQALFPKTPEARAEVAAAAVAAPKIIAYSKKLEADLTAERAKSAKLEADINKIKSAGKPPKSEPASGRIGVELTDTSKMTDDDALEANMAAAGL